MGSSLFFVYVKPKMMAPVWEVPDFFEKSFRNSRFLKNVSYTIAWI